MGRKLNMKAWGSLTQDEQTSLTVQQGMQKSSWQGGEIINRSHYKYLEINYRAKQFLKMFTEHLEAYDRLIPDFLEGDKLVVFFFQRCLEERKKPMEVISQIKEKHRINKSMMNERIIDQLDKWEDSDDAHEKNVFELVKEFDRWNNFRILPKCIQEPSAYKRRLKNVHKKHLKMIAALHPLSLRKFLKHFIAPGTKTGIYMPMIIQGNPLIYTIKNNKQSREILNTIGIYVFTDTKKAKEYLESIELYMSKKKKECKDGLEFWPKYRDLIKEAINYSEVQKISPTRKHLLMAQQKLEFL